MKPVGFLLRGSLAIAGLLVCMAGAQAQNIVYAADSTPTADVPGGLTARAVGTETAYYDSNPLLLTTKTQSLWGSITAPEVILTDKTPLTTVTSDTIFDSNNFNQSNFSSNDVHSKLNFDEQVLRWSAGLQGNVDYDTTRTSEISDYNLQIAPVRHLGDTIAPSLGYNFLPTDKLNLTGAYSSSEYANSVFTNYDIYSATPTYSHQFDQNNTGLVSLQAQRYTATSGVSNKIDTVGAQIGWQRIFTPNLSGDASIGYQQTRQMSVLAANQSWTPQYAFSGDLHYKDEQDLLTIGASRMEFPFGNGTEGLLTQASLSDIHDINKLFSIGANGSYQTAEYQTSAFGNLDSLATVGANLTYHVTEQLDLTTSYQYRYENLIDIPSSAQDHMVLLSISYRTKALSL